MRVVQECDAAHGNTGSPKQGNVRHEPSSSKGNRMNRITCTLAAVLLAGLLSACHKNEEAAPAAAEPAPALAAEAPAAMPAPAAETPAAATDAAAAAPATETPPADAADDSDDTPHSGGDKVGTAPAPAAPPSN